MGRRLSDVVEAMSMTLEGNKAFVGDQVATATQGRSDISETRKQD